MWDLTSHPLAPRGMEPAAPAVGSVESQPLYCQGSPSACLFKCLFPGSSLTVIAVSPVPDIIPVRRQALSQQLWNEYL